MPSIDEVFGGTSLKAADLKGKHVPATIESAEVHQFDDGRKVIVRFRNSDKALIANKTNSNAIAEVTGSRNIEDWTGHKITLYPARVEFQGRYVDAIRVLVGASQNEPAPAPAPAPATAPQPADQDGAGEHDDIPF